VSAGANAAAEKRDLVHELGRVYRPGLEPEIVDVPALRFLMIDGHGDPNGSADYEAAIGALYGLAYGAKFALKKSGGRDVKVAPLEGLWTAPAGRFDLADKSGWEWTMMIAIPEEFTAELIDGAREKAAAKVGADVVARVRIEALAEGRCAQVMHIGPWASEGPTIEALHTFIVQQGLQSRGRHHEVYMSDPRRAAPEKLRTIVRQPVEPAGGAGRRARTLTARPGGADNGRSRIADHHVRTAMTDRRRRSDLRVVRSPKAA
jgi:hypothetical protein